MTYVPSVPRTGDLAADVHAGRFRPGSLLPPNVIEIVVPPLRERRSDLRALCEALLARIAATESGMPAGLARRLTSLRLACRCRAAVRELENLL